MQMRVDDIPEGGLDLHLEWDADKLHQLVPDVSLCPFRCVRPIEADLHVERQTDHVVARGRVEGLLQFECCRCLQPLQWDLEAEIDAYMVPQSESYDDEEVELQAEDLEFEFFDGEVIEIDRLVAEQLFLAIPVKPLCAEQCKGICPGCGAELNRASCSCEPMFEDSPFAVLKALKE
jgi:uncharacterized protein